MSVKMIKTAFEVNKPIFVILELTATYQAIRLWSQSKVDKEDYTSPQLNSSSS